MENTEDVLPIIKDTFSSIKDESSKYANTVIMIIIFLIFLNLFMTTYFYFTSLITANANRSNCGAGGITEAETFRHIFLQDNGNDKTRDIYIIIIAIFAIYMFSEMFKIFEMSDFDINDNHKYIGSILSFILGCVLFMINLSTLMSVLMSALENDILNVPVIILLVFLGLGFIIYIVYIVVNFVIDRTAPPPPPPLPDVNDRNGFFNDKNTKTAFIVFMCIFFISQISLIYSNKNFKNNGFKLINPKFNEFTAMVLMFLVFFILCGIHSLVYGIKLINSWYYLLLLFFSLCLFMFILVSSLDLSFDKNTDEPTHKQLTSIIDFFLAFKWLALLIPFFILIGISFNNSNYRESLIDPTPFIKTLVFYYVLLFVAFLFYVYFMNKESTTGILSLQYFHLYNYNSENSNEEIKNTTDGKESNFYKKVNISNATFVGLFLVILIILLTFAKNNKSTNNLIYGMIVFIIASYVTGIVYLIYNKIFPIQQLSFNYKKNLININKEISTHINTTTKEHTINKEKIFNFNLFSKWTDVEEFKTGITTTTKTKTEKLAIIKDEFRKIAPKGQNYDNYVDQSKDQKDYEEYILNIFDCNFYIDKLSTASTVPSDCNLDIYKKLIIDVPKDLNEITYSYSNYTCNYFTTSIELEIPVSTNLEYIIKKNYQYVTGQEGELQKYTINLSNESSNIPIFYTIGYDYNNYTSLENGSNQVMLGDKLYALPAKYYACAYLNYHPKSDEYMNTMKFKDYIDEKHYEIYEQNKNNIVTIIAKRYNTIVEDAKKDLDPKKFYFLLIFLVILAILLLMYFFNLAKVYIPDTEYSPQMYVLGILAVFLTVFIFGEVIFSRIK
tara:strand:+ start:1573 stop:4095 length:2523 start_codon:yes stop_codon:yes gene_type:complete